MEYNIDVHKHYTDFCNAYDSMKRDYSLRTMYKKTGVTYLNDA